MNSKIKRKEISKNEIKYPYIGICENDDDIMVVLFTKENAGILLSEPNLSEFYTEEDDKLGAYYEDWEEEGFEIFQDEIIISN